MMRIGVVGASGFVGRRAVEMLHKDTTEVRPIVRSAASAMSFTGANLDCHIANVFDQSELEVAFTGCDVIIHSILGSPGLIRGSVAPAYKAAQRVGVRRIIYLSSMIVHTSAPAPGTTESSVPIRNQPFPTHVAKIDAEQKLLQLRKKGAVEVVIFRPGIVFGPRSRWVADLANQLSQGTACLINEGKGICNTVYVDNLIHGIRLALTAAAADGEAFFVGDREQVTWLDFYRPFAEALGIDPSEISQVDVPEFQHNLKQKIIDSVWNSELAQKILASVSNDLKKKIKGAVLRREKRLDATSQEVVIRSQPAMTEMMSILQQSHYKLPIKKAEEILEYKPLVSFNEGCRQSVEWLMSSDELYSAIQR